MESLLTYCPAAYVINLPERTDRLRAVVSEFKRVEWSAGENGVKVFAAKRFEDRGGFPGIGERGAFFSHLGCLQDARQRIDASGYRNVMVLEDDVAFASSLPQLTPSILSQLSDQPWDFCYLGHEQTGEIPRADARTTAVRLEPYEGDLLTAHFLLIHGGILPRLIAHLERVATGIEGDQTFGPMPVDGAYNVFRRINPDVRTLIAIPKLGWQRPSRSDISPRAFDNWQSMQLVLSAMRHLKDAASRWRS